jgi:hypothetical protein
MINFSIWKIFGIFSTLLIVFLFFGSTLVGLVQAGVHGDWKGALANSGGKIFALDKILLDETDYLITATTTPGTPTYDIVFHISYACMVLFMFFVIFTLLYKVGNWIFGLRALSASTDVLIAALILLAFFTLEFLYTLLILHEIVYPLQGVWTFIKHLPPIFQNLFT